MTLPRQLEVALEEALAKAQFAQGSSQVIDGLKESNKAVVSVEPAADTRFGDYQSNLAMVLAKPLQQNPREIAQKLSEEYSLPEIVDEVSVAGPGFINFRINDQFIASRLSELLEDNRLGVEEVSKPQTIILDYSSPNIAKSMHVGHVRSTLIGDCLQRAAKFLGHNLISDNHIGDWGTQFGKIIYGMKHLVDESALSADPMAELGRIYREVNALAKKDSTVEEVCRAELQQLQSGDQENREIWEKCTAWSIESLKKIYDRLGVSFDHWLGESFYHERLGPLVEKLERDGVAEESDGALCVFFAEHDKLSEDPCMVRKSDGAYNYATTDLATMDYRLEEWQADAMWYVVGAPQSLHFSQIFEVAAQRGITAELIHIAHGNINGSDGRMMKTREGDNVPLVDLLEEAEERARTIISEKNPEMEEQLLGEVTEAIGMGAIKYAELSQARMTDYIFDLERMLSFQGNTAPYLQNSYVRARAIFRKLGETPVFEEELLIEHEKERALAMLLLQFSEAVPAVLEGFRPNHLANYLYELARAYHSFYESCPVLKAEGSVRNTRLILCELTSRVLKCGLDLLGIKVTERM